MRLTIVWALCAAFALTACQTSPPLPAPRPIFDIGAGLTIRPGVPPASLDGLDRWELHFWERLDVFRAENAALSPAERTVILLGDSLTEGFVNGDRAEQSLPAGYHFLNRGITSDHILGEELGILRRMGVSVYDAQPSHVFFLMGVNDLGRTWRREGTPAVARVFAGYRMAVDAMLTRIPNLTVCLVTTTPVGGRYEGITPYILEYNVMVRELAEERGLPLIDLFSLIADDENHMPESLSQDGLHFGDEGYRIYGREIARVLSETPGN